jgi:hypothetical protein
MLRSSVSVVLVGVVLGVGAGTVAAGEVPWTYTTTVTAGNDALVMDMGRLDLPDPATGGTTRHYYYGQLSHPNPTGGFDGAARWRVVGFGVGDIQERMTPNPPGYTNDMHITLSIRDEASGEVGELTTSSFVGFVVNHNDGDRIYPYIGANLDPHTLVLGDNRYVVNFRYNQDVNEAWFEASVKIQPASQTPEPGTVALAGIGIGAVGGWVRRRRTG